MADHGYDRTTGSNMATFSFLQLAAFQRRWFKSQVGYGNLARCPNQVERSLGNFIEVPAGMPSQWICTCTEPLRWSSYLQCVTICKISNMHLQQTAILSWPSYLWGKATSVTICKMCHIIKKWTCTGISLNSDLCIWLAIIFWEWHSDFRGSPF